MVYLYDACDQISDFCHQQLLRKMRWKISWTDGRTDRRKTVYPPRERGYNNKEFFKLFNSIFNKIGYNCFIIFQDYLDIKILKSYEIFESFEIYKIYKKNYEIFEILNFEKF